MGALTPKAIVDQLNKYIVGQEEAKRAVAIAICNRERRKKLSPELQREVLPKNLLMTGPTGVGKTEIARRVSLIVNAPFLKVEATKFTEVGYVGRDVESIIHELVEASVSKLYKEKLKEIGDKAEKLATDRIINSLCRQIIKKERRLALRGQKTAVKSPRLESRAVKEVRSVQEIKRQVAEMLKNNKLDEHVIEIEIGRESDPEMLADYSYDFETGVPEDIATELGGEMRSFLNQRKRRRVSVKDARRILAREEANKLIDFEQLIGRALEQAEEGGVVFIDEIDKLVGPKIDVGRDVSGDGVQRDLLPILEGTTVFTKYGSVKTDYILFISAGTFYQNKPADLIPEIQGRFPLRVELKALNEADFVKILMETDNSLLKQYKALLATEGLEIEFTPDGVEEVARAAAEMNEKYENIGARRLHTVVEKIMEDLSFNAPDRRGQRVLIDRSYVQQNIEKLMRKVDLDKYII